MYVYCDVTPFAGAVNVPGRGDIVPSSSRFGRERVRTNTFFRAIPSSLSREYLTITGCRVD